MGDLDDQLQRMADQRAERTPVTPASSVIGRSARPRAPMWWLAAAAMLAVLAGLGAWLVTSDGNDAVDSVTTTSTLPTTTITATTSTTIAPADPVQSVAAIEYGLVIDVPADWTEIEPNRTWGGDSGFAAVDTAPSGSLQESAAAVVAAARGILGAAPTMEDITVAGRAAIRIVGSETITSDFGSFIHAVTVMPASQPYVVHDETWTYIGIGGDLEHHDAVLASLEWVDRDPTLQHIVLKDQGIEFDIPADWSTDNSRRWDGESGFVAVGLASTADLDAATDNTANHRLRPYGDNPVIEQRAIDGQPARLVVGSGPGAFSEPGAELLATPPARIVLGGAAYGTLTVAAFADDIEAIIASIRWISVDPPPARVSVTQPDPDIAYDLIAGVDSGVEMRHAANPDYVDVIDSLGPVALAFLVDDHLVYQPAFDVSRTDLRGEIRVLGVGGGGWRTPELGEGFLRLLDASIIDGVGHALFTQRTGDTPETANEDLMLLNLDDETTTNLGRVGGWESGLADARFADGAIALLYSAEGFSWMAAVDYSGAELWTHEEQLEDGPHSIAVDGTTILAVTTSRYEAEPAVRLADFDLRTGQPLGSTFGSLNIIEPTVVDPDLCRRLIAGDAFRCGQRGDRPPLEITNSVELEVRQLAGFSQGTPTVVDGSP